MQVGKERRCIKISHRQTSHKSLYMQSNRPQLPHSLSTICAYRTTLTAVVAVVAAVAAYIHTYTHIHSCLTCVGVMSGVAAEVGFASSAVERERERKRAKLALRGAILLLLLFTPSIFPFLCLCLLFSLCFALLSFCLFHLSFFCVCVCFQIGPLHFF